ncbi:O-acetyl-ADP-ribose deacetylase [Jatrophihabitans sp.]|jgi:O-acetyl-ADP-ribose deacetylase (regulator of RNase III)|uniref:O-acetyl-ADP-ribose deacetylase n=1 Tax=Jatrophihabitans sp. TaxID=1932789 RepID=UPI0038CD2BA8
MRLELVLGDITEQHVDAVVNAANSSLLGGSGVDGAIHRRGGPEIVRACRALRADAYPHGLPTGHAVATTAGRLPARWVIHTVGPVYSDTEDRGDLLRSCYRRSLQVADELGAGSVAFPLVSAGAYRWPVRSAVEVAVDVLRSARPPGTSVKTARLVLWQPETLDIAREVLAAATGSAGGTA